MMDEKHEAAQNLMLLFHSPVTPAPRKAAPVYVPPFQLDSQALMTSPNPVWSNIVSNEEKVPESLEEGKGNLSLLISEMEKQAPKDMGRRSGKLLHCRDTGSHTVVITPRGNVRRQSDEEVVLLPRLRSQAKRRAASISLGASVSKRRAVSLDSIGALSEPSPRPHRSLARIGNVGAYSVEERRKVILRYLEKRKQRVWGKRIKYAVRKKFADSRLRVKGRFISKGDEGILREGLMLML